MWQIPFFKEAAKIRWGLSHMIISPFLPSSRRKKKKKNLGQIPFSFPRKKSRESTGGEYLISFLYSQVSLAARESHGPLKYFIYPWRVVFFRLLFSSNAQQFPVHSDGGRNFSCFFPPPTSSLSLYPPFSIRGVIT